MSAITDLFERLGHLFGTAATANAEAVTNLPTEFQNIIDDFANLNPTYQTIISTLPSRLQTVQNSLDVTASAMGQIGGNLITQWAADNEPSANGTLSTALNLLIQRMLAQSDYVTANTPTINPPSAVGSPASLLFFQQNVLGADGTSNQNLLAETLTLTVASVAGALNIVGQTSAPNQMGWQWPLGSGLRTAMVPQLPRLNGDLLQGAGDFDSASVGDANVPAGWLVQIGVSGTTIKLSTVEVQSVAITGTPTAGYYYLVYTDAAGATQQTVAIPYNASGSVVQQALQSLVGLASVTVSTTGTIPNFTHSVTFSGIVNSPTLLAVVNFTTSGTFNVTRATAGGLAYHNRALVIAGDGSELTSLLYSLELQPQTQYALCGFFTVAAVHPAAGIVQFALIDGSTGAVIQDDQGVDNSQTFDLHTYGTTDTFTGAGMALLWRTPSVLPPNVYLQIALTTAITAGKSLVMDYFSLAVVAPLYAGGPTIVCFSGVDPTTAGPCYPGDQWTVAVDNTLSNSGSAGFQSWFQRAFSSNSLGLQLPTAGSNLISDSLIA